ncbi:phage baseplate assembly protein V [Pseudomonas putida]|nr:phage baseplate assembly protein V [Pseudomonas putida]
MYELVRRVVNQLLAPLIERLAELETELEDMRRRSENHNRIGTVSAVDAGSGTCKVSHGDLTTPPIKWMNPSAGEVSETRVPSVGEQCLLINYGGGDGGAHTVALCGLTSDAYPAPSGEANLRRQVYPDGTEWSYDHAASALSWKNGPLSVNADRNGLVVMLGSVGFKLGAAGFDHIKGLVTHDGVNVGKDHLHDNTMPKDGAQSGPPVGGA